MDTIAQFAGRIKAKYPDYQDIPDNELVSRIIAKHPEYKDSVNLNEQPEAPQTQPAQAEPSLLQAALPSLGRTFQPRQTPMPFSYGVNPQMRTVGQGEQRGIRAAMEALSAPSRALGSLAGQLGYTGATGGEKSFKQGLSDPQTGILRPVRESLGNQMSKDIQTLKEPGRPLSRRLGDIARIGVEGAGTLVAGAAEDPITYLTGVGALAKTGKLGETAKSISSQVRSISGKLAPKAESAAERIQQTVLRPRASDWNSGADIKNVAKYQVQGNVDEVIAKSDTKIKAASDQLREAIKTGADEGATVNLNAVIDKAKKKLQREGGADLVDAMGPAISKFRRWAKIESERKAGNLPGHADLLQSQEFKQMMGSHGAWEKTSEAKRMGITEGERYQSRAAQAVYLELKDAIEQAAPAGVKEINKALSELIPLRNTAVYRKIVADRNNPIGISDMMSAMTAIGNGPAGAAMLAATRFTKSGVGAKSMYSIADKLRRLSGAKTPAEAGFYIKNLEKQGMEHAEIRDALQEIRRPLDLNTSNAPAGRKVIPQPNLRRPLPLLFGEPAKETKKVFDPLDMLAESPSQSVGGSVEDLAAAQVASNKSKLAEEGAKSREAFIRQGRERVQAKQSDVLNFRVIPKSDVNIRPRNPAGDVQPNFPQKYVESPAFAKVLDKVAERRKLEPTMKGAEKMETLYHGSSSGNIGNDAGMMQLSIDPEVAKQYAGKNGSAWSVTPNKNTKTLEMSNKETERIGFDMYKDYQNGNLDMAGELENALGKSELSAADFKKIAKGFNPDEIVNSAEMWDNQNAVQWFVNKYNVDYVKTKNGGIVLDPSKVDKNPLKGQ